MKYTFVLFLSCFCAVLAGCSNSGGVAASFDGKTEAVEAKSTAVLTSTTSEAVMHTFIIANYDLPEKITKMSVFKSAKEDGKKRIEFSIIGPKGSDENTAVATGVYPSRVGNAGAAYNTANGGKLSFGSGKKEQSKGLDFASMKEGKVEITAVSDSEIKGSVDITDGNVSIKGSFVIKK